jgi:LemA protein
LTEITQQIHSLRASGVISSQAKRAVRSATRASFKSLGTACTSPLANVNFLELQRELSDTENKIQAARRFYNSNVRDLNTKIEIFPSNMIAGIFKFSKMEFFDIPDDGVEQKPVEVKF